MNQATEREPFPLPISYCEDHKYRNRLLNMYAALLWRHSDSQKIVPILEFLYEEAYSNGMKAMDNMHKTLNSEDTNKH